MKRFHLLVTRKLNERLAEEAKTRGIELTEQEFISIQPIRTAEKRIELNSKLLHAPPLVFTSKYAVQNFMLLLQPGQEHGMATAPVYCLEGATLEEVKKHFAETQIMGTAANAVALAEIITAREEKKNILFICGDRRRDELPELLQARGRNLTEVIVYSTQLSPATMQGPYDAVAFFSPSAVESFFSANSMPADIVCFSVGKTTSAEIRKYVHNRIIVTEKPSETMLMEAVFAYHQEYQYNNQEPTNT